MPKKKTKGKRKPAAKRRRSKTSKAVRSPRETSFRGRRPRAGKKALPTSSAEARKRMRSIIDTLTREHPEARCMLNFSSPFELLIATILAAQCTDAMVNRVTETLFKTYPSPQAFLDASPDEVERAIYRTGFFRNKTKSIKKCCQMLVEKHGGEVPSTMDELLALGGVGRKTANCVLGNAFGVPGIVVDTHVRRLANRMGFTRNTDPDKIEADLNEIVPPEKWTQFSHVLAGHGRTYCTARAPRCEECPIEHQCPKILD